MYLVYEGPNSWRSITDSKIKAVQSVQSRMKLFKTAIQAIHICTLFYIHSKTGQELHNRICVGHFCQFRSSSF